MRLYSFLAFVLVCDYCQRLNGSEVTSLLSTFEFFFPRFMRRLKGKKMGEKMRKDEGGNKKKKRRKRGEAKNRERIQAISHENTVENTYNLVRPLFAIALRAASKPSTQNGLALALCAAKDTVLARKARQDAAERLFALLGLGQLAVRLGHTRPLEQRRAAVRLDGHVQAAAGRCQLGQS